jgi:hypothetical protein
VNPRLSVGATETLFSRAFDHDPGGNVPDYDVAADGRFLMLRRADVPRGLRVLLHWAG